MNINKDREAMSILLHKAFYACNGVPTGVDEYGICIPTKEQRKQLFNLILSHQSDFMPVIGVAKELLKTATDKNSPGAMICRTLIAHSQYT
jgi:hypothetical protein